MYLYEITAREVGEIITNLDNKSPSGVDLSNILIKLSSDVIIPYLVFYLTKVYFLRICLEQECSHYTKRGVNSIRIVIGQFQIKRQLKE